jgi:hypothetical protein
MSRTRQLFLESLAEARSVVASDLVNENWERPSALREMSIKALVGHLLRAPITVTTYLDNPPGTGTPTTPAAYFDSILKSTDIEHPVHVGVRRRGLEEAMEGHDDVVARWDEATSRLHEVLEIEPSDRLVVVGGDLLLSLDDYLVTRLVEVMVHTDDLAASVGIEGPNFQPEAAKLIFEAMVETARLRHGDVAVMRAFTRRERDAQDALQVF